MSIVIQKKRLSDKRAAFDTKNPQLVRAFLSSFFVSTLFIARTNYITPTTIYQAF